MKYWIISLPNFFYFKYSTHKFTDGIKVTWLGYFFRSPKWDSFPLPPPVKYPGNATHSVHTIKQFRTEKYNKFIFVSKDIYSLWSPLIFFNGSFVEWFHSSDLRKTATTETEISEAINKRSPDRRVWYQLSLGATVSSNN